MSSMAATYRSRVSSKGQLVIPAEVRNRLGFKPGNEVVFTESEGRLVIEKQTFDDILKLQGALKDDGAFELLQEEREREHRRLEWLGKLWTDDTYSTAFPPSIGQSADTRSFECDEPQPQRPITGILLTRERSGRIPSP